MAYKIEKHLKTLELDRVLEMLSNEATLPEAKSQALNIKPETTLNNVKELIKQTEEAYLLISGYTSPNFGRTTEYIISSVARAQIGGVLSVKDLLGVAELLRNIRTVKNWREDCSSLKELSIDCFFSLLNPNKYLEDKINFAIKNEEELNDNASPLLSQLRRKILSKSSKIREDLEKLVRSQTAKYLQEAIITQRDGRFVVPVKAEYRNEVKGLIHDTSSTGSTVFIEPMSVVETNNEIRVLKLKEQEEIARILSELSAFVSDFSESIKNSYKALCTLDLIFAKAKLAVSTGAIVPKLNDKGYIYLKNARHPLINKRTVVPITVSLGNEYNTLIITGPNTGGKTVTLKTIGLFTVMAMCGLMIPADDNSEISVFSKIFADIGDEQSIEQSLSTFSSHMVNIISITEECDENSLVLFDELCAGTDPVEGAALAKAILMRLLSLGVKTVATTHYPELKAFALDTEYAQNASCEFDVSTLKPTYRLIIGVPGRSNAFAISKRLGLDQTIIDTAKEQVSDDDLRFERVVASLERARQSAEEERRTAAKLRKELADSKKRTEALEHEFKIKQEKLMEKTRIQASSIVEDARYKSGVLLNELEEIKKTLNAENATKQLELARKNYKNTLNDMQNSADPIIKNESRSEKLKKLPEKGDIVVINTFNKDATVIETDLKNKRVFVISGSMKMWVGLDELREKKSSSSSEIKKTRNVRPSLTKAQHSVSGEIDIRGMACDEAIMELDKYLDNALLSGYSTVTVIHGKGTGTLRNAVHSHLRSLKYIKSFRVGLFGEGENGVTIAEFES